LLFRFLKASIDPFPGQFGIALAAADHEARAGDLKIENVTLTSSEVVGNFLRKLLGSAFLATPFGQQVASEGASIVVITRLELACLIEESALVGCVPVLVLGYQLRDETIPDTWWEGQKLP
jgi:hypothetical protein